MGRPTLPPAPPSGSATARLSVTPAPVVSPVPLTRLPDLPIGAAAIEAEDDAVWVVTRTGLLEERAAAAGTVRRSVQLPRVPTDLLVTADTVWSASPTGALVRVDRATFEIREVAGAIGSQLADGGGEI